MFFLLLLVIPDFFCEPIYRLSNFKETRNGFQGNLTLESGTGPYEGDYKNLVLQVFYETESRLRIKIVDPQEIRWQVFDYILRDKTPEILPEKVDYKFDVQQECPFSFIVTRICDGVVLFNSSTLVFEDQYLSIKTHMEDNPNLYGLPDRFGQLKLRDGFYTMFNRGKHEIDLNSYGSHPFFLRLHPGGTFSGIFLFNSNPLDIVLSGDTLEYRAIGGVLDLFVFSGPNPDSVAKSYHRLVGFPHLQPRWALGFHHCRYGYENVGQVADVAEKYISYGIPIDGLWMDIDYMDGYRDFTLDPVNFPEDKVSQFSDYLHNNNKKLIVITDPGIKLEVGYEPYDQGLMMDLFIKNKVGEPLINSVWPGKRSYLNHNYLNTGYTAFPSFQHPRAYSYWRKFLEEFHDKIKFDGLWIDMNEIRANCDGECYPEWWNSNVSFGQNENVKFNPDNPPYVPGDFALNRQTLSMSGYHPFGKELEYNVHNLYGYHEAMISSQVMEDIRQARSFVLTRSSWAGSGFWTSHWTGDNSPNFENLKLSISNILGSNLAGVSHTGADVCGFRGDTSPELCSRWISLSIFYPFARNHNSKGSKGQEPWTLGIVNSTRDSLLMRYSLIPYFYTEFVKIHMAGGCFWRPMFFECPNDANCYDIEVQFFVGEILLVSPIFFMENSDYEMYIPTGVWYDYYSHSKIVMASGKFVDYPEELDKIPTLLKGGTILPTQVAGMNTIDQQFNSYVLTVCLDANENANGELIIDDGNSVDTIEQNAYTHLKIVWTDNTLESSFIVNGFKDIDKCSCSTVTILGVEKSVQTVTVNEVVVTSWEQKGEEILIFNLDIKLGIGFKVKIS